MPSRAYITVAQSYDALGRKYRVSNPFRSGDTTVWTTTGFDALSRVTSVTTPDGSVVGTAYSGNAVTVTDQVGKLRRSITDALGRLTCVDEPDNSSSIGSLGTLSSPNQATSYSYDALDDLDLPPKNWPRIRYDFGTVEGGAEWPKENIVRSSPL